MAFTFKHLEIPGLILVKPRVFKDRRGFFAEVYKWPDFKKAGIHVQFVQVNCSQSQKNVLRGLHYQKRPVAQAKLVRVLSGEIFDVAVDIRKGSPFFGKWVGFSLSSAEMNMAYVPKGFAHGFCVLSKTAEIEYYSSDVYSPQHERGIIWNDPALKIRWPSKSPVLSKKDSVLPSLELADNNFIYEEE